MLNPLKLFREVIDEKKIDKKWASKPHEAFKNLPNSSKGDAGEEFIKRYCKSLGFKVDKISRIGDWDLEIKGKKFEIKLASEDTTGSFQFNHIRYDSKYHYLLCLGVTPNNLIFDIWSKADVATGEAGSLVSMGKNQNSSFKLTKKLKELKPINEFKKTLTELLA